MNIEVHSGESDVTREVEIRPQDGSVDRALKVIYTENIPGVGPIRFERRFPGALFVKFGIPSAMIENEQPRHGEEISMRDNPDAGVGYVSEELTSIGEPVAGAAV